MEKEKDNNKGQKHSTQVNGNMLTNNNSMLNKDKSGEIPKMFVFVNKAEKLTTATYMVASFIPSEDPIKDKIRVISINFLSDIHAMNKAAGNYHHRINQVVDEILSFLSIAASVNLISDMNHSILEREYRNLKQLIDMGTGRQKPYDKSLTIKEEFFEAGTPGPDLLQPGIINVKANSVSYKGQNIIKDTKEDNMSFIKNNQISLDKNINKPDSYGERQKNRRRQEILNIIKKKKDITIKDISGSVVGCSGKTLQRELLSLVRLGVLKKEGEKRWSRYSLTQISSE